MAELDGIPARLIVDTGAGQTLILHPWFVEKKNLRQRYPRRVKMVTGGGMLGLMRGELVRVPTLKLGACSLANVCVEFGSKNNDQAGQVAGYIGAVILRRFHLLFDAEAQQMFFEPNTGFSDSLPTPACLRAGLVCFPEGANWIVRDVVPGSPAAEAGVRLGDRLLEIDGRPVQTLQFIEIKNAFRANPGTRVQLRLQTGEDLPREAVVVLRDLL